MKIRKFIELAIQEDVKGGDHSSLSCISKTNNAEVKLLVRENGIIAGVNIAKEIFYALDESEKQGFLDQIKAEKKRGNITVQRFKGLGEMNPIQLRETTMAPATRRLIQLTLDNEKQAIKIMDMLLAKKRSPDRKKWLEANGDRAIIV